tara:strand:+ start:41 stop:502 length:462 start_codon:yes stop_codon:yes gene_type:complete
METKTTKLSSSEWEDLITEKLDNRDCLDSNEVDKDDKEKIVLDYYEAEMDDGYSGHFDIYFYTETTQDGYEIWVATHDECSPSITEDVYYYDTDWFEKLPDAIKSGYRINIDSYAKEEYGYADAIDEVYEDYYQAMRDEINDELINEGYEKEE